jgi:transposase
MTELVAKRGRGRRTYSDLFKQELVDQCITPGMSLANVARQHDLHPTLLARWVKERTGPTRNIVSPQSLLVPQFVPVHVEQARCIEDAKSTIVSSKVEVNIDRGDVHIQFKVDSSQMVELGHVLREVLR